MKPIDADALASSAHRTVEGPPLRRTASLPAPVDGWFELKADGVAGCNRAFECPSASAENRQRRCADVPTVPTARPLFVLVGVAMASVALRRLVAVLPASSIIYPLW